MAASSSRWRDTSTDSLRPRCSSVSASTNASTATQAHLRGAVAASQTGVVVVLDALALRVQPALAVAGARHRTAAARATDETCEHRRLVTVHRAARAVTIVDNGLPDRARNERLVRVLDDDALAADRALEPADVERGASRDRQPCSHARAHRRRAVAHGRASARATPTSRRRAAARRRGESPARCRGSGSSARPRRACIRSASSPGRCRARARSVAQSRTNRAAAQARAARTRAAP